MNAKELTSVYEPKSRKF